MFRHSETISADDAESYGGWLPPQYGELSYGWQGMLSQLHNNPVHKSCASLNQAIASMVRDTNLEK